ncbi:hypothetical protein [Haloplanus pelagicus]|jgi:hypothetical protein|uniref:hypothetical protein n=1 Tax=Haloplanus pelagicus TaxID=2949995 RepID=UPI00203AD904|nr:hypothetical protein [Haloplanus sp. HW8-1]
MPDESRFNGISEALEGDDDQANDADDETAGADSTHDTTAEEPPNAATPADEKPTERSADMPAFTFDETTQRPLYARESAWEAFEDTLDLDVGMVLRREYGVRDVPKRELHDAALRVVANHPEEVATALLEGRGIDVNGSDPE